MFHTRSDMFSSRLRKVRLFILELGKSRLALSLQATDVHVKVSHPVLEGFIVIGEFLCVHLLLNDFLGDLLLTALEVVEIFVYVFEFGSVLVKFAIGNSHFVDLGFKIFLLNLFLTKLDSKLFDFRFELSNGILGQM